MSAVIFDHRELENTKLVARQIGDELRAAREARGHTREQLAARVRTHVTTIARIERGEQHNVKLGNLVKALRYYGLTLSVHPTRDL